MTPSFTHLSITFSNQRFSICSPTAGVGFVKLTTDSFCGKWAFKVNIQFCCHLCCNSSLFFKTTVLNVRRSLSVSVHFRPLFLFADVFPGFMETVALDTTNNVAVFVADAPSKRALTMMCPVSKSDKSPIFRFFRKGYHSTQSLMH
jgi:hypothetical protein